MTRPKFIEASSVVDGSKDSYDVDLLTGVQLLEGTLWALRTYDEVVLRSYGGYGGSSGVSLDCSPKRTGVTEPDDV